jgi:1-aminocyclopropane-1-carboxylate deaminase
VLTEFKTPSPVQELKSNLYTKFGLRVYLKRDDQIHPIVSGNKWRKLKHSIQFAVDNKLTGVVTFGGAFSNHLHATAYACKSYDLSCVAIIRGEYADEKNPTLSDIQEQGTHLIKVSREEYRFRNDLLYLEVLKEKYPNYLIVPEGGRTELGIVGVGEIWKEFEMQPDHIFVPVGSSTTLCGLLVNQAKSSQVHLHGIACVKDNKLIKRVQEIRPGLYGVSYYDQFTQGGFAKVNPSLIQFINDFKTEHGVQLEPIYTAKMFMAFHELIEEDRFVAGQKIVLIHTGGLQGIRGHNLRYENRPELCIEV